MHGLPFWFFFCCFLAKSLAGKVFRHFEQIIIFCGDTCGGCSSEQECQSQDEFVSGDDAGRVAWRIVSLTTIYTTKMTEINNAQAPTVDLS